ncbi:MAG: 4-alpha-glucanotransferase [Candidatus Omnitrophica bacterium]|nr:4-alpha-glucanotransferase [Candidatus Omnitrophota bacterium]
MPNGDTLHFLNSPASAQWRRIGARRRAGVLVPLFSVYSKESVGIGQFTDLAPLGKWAASAGLGILQLLPLNDVGSRFCPYDAESSFALDPMYLDLARLREVSLAPFKKAVARLAARFKIRPPAVDYRIKPAKLEWLWEIFQKNRPARRSGFWRYAAAQAFWLPDYACFKALKERFDGRSWEEWPADLRDRRPGPLRDFEKERAERVEFFQWLQWQSACQLGEAKRSLRARGVFLMGDLPFLVSRDSADVWARPGYFKLDLAAGAPPDEMFPGGQKWGMPPYRWEKISGERYGYLAQKLRTAGDFYDLFRIDHFVGFFRLWTIPVGEGDGVGFFDPPDEKLWEGQGRQILSAILESAPMLPCAEDLGMVPRCSAPVLREFSVPGMEVQRWARTEDEKLKEPGEYRPNSTAVISTHDTSPLVGWWESDCPEGERARFWSAFGLTGKPSSACTPALAEAALAHSSRSASVFSIQLLQDWFALGGPRQREFAARRVNVPGTVNDRNWTALMPCPLEELGRLGLHQKIKTILRQTGRL